MRSALPLLHVLVALTPLSLAVPASAQSASTTTVSILQQFALVDAPVTLVATVSAGGSAAYGNVVFTLTNNATQQTTTYNSAVTYAPQATPIAQYQINSLPLGSYTVVAAYQGGSYAAPSSSAPYQFAVNAPGGPAAAHLQGQYAFLFEGYGAAQSTPVFAGGSFVTDGAGHLSSGVLDTNLAVNQQPQFNLSITGTYYLAANGMGTLNLNTPLGAQSFNLYLPLANTPDAVATGGGTSPLVGSMRIAQQTAGTNLDTSAMGVELLGLANLYQDEYTGILEAGTVQFPASGTGTMQLGVSEFMVGDSQQSYTLSAPVFTNTPGRFTFSSSLSGSASSSGPNFIGYRLDADHVYLISIGSTVIAGTASR